MSMIGQYRRLSAAALRDLLAAPDRLTSVLYPDDDGAYQRDFLDIDKAWHLIHFLLNGEPWDGEWPLGALILGGAEVSEEDLGYGPARYFTPGQVRELSDALSLVEPDVLWGRFDADAVQRAEIYPQHWSGGPEDREYVCRNYEALRAFIAATAANGDVLVAYVS